MSRYTTLSWTTEWTINSRRLSSPNYCFIFFGPLLRWRSIVVTGYLRIWWWQIFCNLITRMRMEFMLTNNNDERILDSENKMEFYEFYDDNSVGLQRLVRPILIHYWIRESQKEWSESSHEKWMNLRLSLVLWNEMNF